MLAPWFRVVFAGGGSAGYNNHELAPLLASSENDSRLWFYDFPTGWLTGTYPVWIADIDPGYRGFGGAVAQIGGPISWQLRRHGADEVTTRLGTVPFFLPLCSTWDRLYGKLFSARDRNNFKLIVQ